MRISRLDNRHQAKTSWFVMACGLAGVAPTKRQMSKYRNGKGKAYAFNHPNSMTSVDKEKEKEMNVIKEGLALLRKWGSVLEEYERI